jgi:DNA-binding transcriptional regulator YiaG
MNFKELREASGMSRPKFADYFGIPYRTVQSWELGDRKCPEYLLDLMKYKLIHEGIIK